MKKGKVYLTGGGCGDIGLLTLRAADVLCNCDTVVYDSLVTEEVLQWTPPYCERIYVGKRYGSHAMEQEKINALLVEKARAGKRVVRLKGGDPYLFGRGGEEFLALAEAGIDCEEIPGISSALAVPAAAGIPVTHRGLSAGVIIVTGTTAEEGTEAKLKLDFDLLARFTGTLVILMGMHHLQEIEDGLQRAGKAADTPCAVIMEGTTKRQRCLRTELSRLSAEAKEQGFTAPAVIVIGMTAKMTLMSSNNDKAKNEALTDICVGITGTPHFVNKVAASFASEGADVWDMGFLEICPNKMPLPALADCGWLVFTSPNGARVFLEKMRREKKDLRALSGKRIAAVGPGTAAVFAENGIYADYVPQVYAAEHLAQGLAERILEEQKDGRKDKLSAALLRARQGSEALPRILAEKGISFLEYPLYEVEIREDRRAAVIEACPEYLVFGSALGVRSYFEGLRQAGLTNPKNRYVCIGKQCAEELQKYTDGDFLTAQEAGVEAIVRCVCDDAIAAK